VQVRDHWRRRRRVPSGGSGHVAHRGRQQGDIIIVSPPWRSLGSRFRTEPECELPCVPPRLPARRCCQHGGVFPSMAACFPSCQHGGVFSQLPAWRRVLTVLGIVPAASAAAGSRDSGDGRHGRQGSQAHCAEGGIHVHAVRHVILFSSADGAAAGRGGGACARAQFWRP